MLITKDFRTRCGRRPKCCVHIVAAVITVLVAFTTSCGGKTAGKASRFCAIMPDSIGLYVGNPVTQMGYKIGTVDGVAPNGTAVKVDFTITENRAIPFDVKAATRSVSILADRSLELVGNYTSGPRLSPNQCIPLDHSSTPLSLSQVIGSATNFLNGITPDGSTNIQDAVRGVDNVAQGNGQPANQLLTRTSQLLDNPDQAVSDLGSITRNMARLTSVIKDNRDPLKEILRDMPVTGPDLVVSAAGAQNLAAPLAELIQAVSDIELKLGTDFQLMLDTVADALRHLSPHYKGLANILNPIPRWISGLNFEPPDATAGGLAKHVNNHLFNLLPWRPPLFRIGTHNGLALCGRLNASMPGSCADVAGQPYAVDVALLQYVLAEAQK